MSDTRPEINAIKTYTFVIGSTDDFEGVLDLKDYVDQEGAGGNLSYSVYEFKAASEVPEGMVTLIGHGIAFGNGWCSEGTLSFFVEGVIEGNDSDHVATNPELHRSCGESRAWLGFHCV